MGLREEQDGSPGRALPSRPTADMQCPRRSQVHGLEWIPGCRHSPLDCCGPSSQTVPSMPVTLGSTPWALLRGGVFRGLPPPSCPGRHVRTPWAGCGSLLGRGL